jgi:hypothetical protein
MNKYILGISGWLVAIATSFAFVANQPNRTQPTNPVDSTVRYCMPDSEYSGYWCSKAEMHWIPNNSRAQ